MINALRSLGQGQVQGAWWAEKNAQERKFIQVEPISDQERRFSNVIQNLITSENSVVVRTAYVYDYKPRQHIFYRDMWWEIASVSRDMTAVNPQVLPFVSCGSPQFIIELIEANGYDKD